MHDTVRHACTTVEIGFVENVPGGRAIREAPPKRAPETACYSRKPNRERTAGPMLQGSTDFPASAFQVRSLYEIPTGMSIKMLINLTIACRRQTRRLQPASRSPESAGAPFSP